MAKTLRIKTKLEIFKGRPDLTPLVDVLFLLLFFLMLSSSFVQVSGIKVDLPETLEETGGTQNVEKFVVTIDSDANYFFNDQPLPWEMLKEKLLGLSSIQNEKQIISTIVIRADKATPFEAVANLMGVAEEVNLSAVVATVNPAKKPTQFEETEIE